MQDDTITEPLALCHALIDAMQREADVRHALVREGYEAWNEGREARVGKLLMALRGMAGYRVDLDAARHRVASLMARYREAQRSAV